MRLDYSSSPYRTSSPLGDTQARTSRLLAPPPAGQNTTSRTNLTVSDASAKARPPAPRFAQAHTVLGTAMLPSHPTSSLPVRKVPHNPLSSRCHRRAICFAIMLLLSTWEEAQTGENNSSDDETPPSTPKESQHRHLTPSQAIVGNQAPRNVHQATRRKRPAPPQHQIVSQYMAHPPSIRHLLSHPTIRAQTKARCRMIPDRVIVRARSPYANHYSGNHLDIGDRRRNRRRMGR